MGRKLNKIKTRIETKKEGRREGQQGVKRKNKKRTGRTDCLDVVSDKAILYKRYNNQLRQITRMLKNSGKAAKKRDKAKTAFTRVFKAISGASLNGTACPNEPSEKPNATQAFNVLKDCNTTAFSICNEAVLPDKDETLAETCKKAMSEAVNAFEVYSFKDCKVLLS